MLLTKALGFPASAESSDELHQAFTIHSERRPVREVPMHVLDEVVLLDVVAAVLRKLLDVLVDPVQQRRVKNYGGVLPALDESAPQSALAEQHDNTLGGV